MVHKIGEATFKVEDLNRISNHKNGIHTIDGAKDWLEEMDTALTQKEQELNKIDAELDQDFAHAQQEQIEAEKEQELWETKQQLEDQRDELETQREELHELRKEMMEKELRKMDEDKPCPPCSTTGEMYLERPTVASMPTEPQKPFMEKLQEQAVKVAGALGGVGRFVESLPTKIMGKGAKATAVVAKTAVKVKK